MAKYDVIALGELLIDFTENGLSGQGNPLMEANPGGAPCNVLSMLNNLGHKTAFVGKVGDDMFGNMLAGLLDQVGIDTKGLRKDKEVHTTLAFVHTMPGGDRDFSFYRNPGADMMISVDDLDEEMLKDCRIFHFGTLSTTHETCREATYKAVAIAKEAGALISFDPNLREPLWNSLEDAWVQVDWGMKQCNVLKISDNEILWFTGKDNFDDAIKVLQENYNIDLILLSMGKDGSRAYMNGQMVEVAANLQEGTIETTGAGDTFCACVLHYVLEHGNEPYTAEQMTEMLHFANVAASIITTRKGALKVMPTVEEIKAQL